jgi:hypothetical protein
VPRVRDSSGNRGIASRNCEVYTARNAEFHIASAVFRSHTSRHHPSQ